MSKCSKVSQFMVRDVVEAKPWQPVSYVRQQMLKHGFSYIPVWFKDEKKWKLISEYAIAKYLRGYPDKRNDLLAKTIEEAEKDGLCLPTVEEKDIVSSEELLSSILGRLGAKPLLVVAPKREDEPERKDELAGILTSSDIL